MSRYEPYVPQTVGELLDQLGAMMLLSPLFKDPTGYFAEQDINTEFFALLEGLKNVRAHIGQERCDQLVQMAAKMRVHFEADPNDETEDSIKGRDIILDMEEILKGARSKR